MCFLKEHNQHYSSINLDTAHVCLESIETDDDGSVFETIRSMEEDEVEMVMNCNFSSNEIDPSDVEIAAEQNLGPETGGASGACDRPEYIEETVCRPVTDVRMSEEQRNVAILQQLVPNARPPQNDPIPWPETSSFVNDFDTTGLYSMAFPCLFPYGCGDPSNCDRNVALTENNCGKHFIKYAINIKKAQEILLSDENLSIK